MFANLGTQIISGESGDPKRTTWKQCAE